MLLLTFSTKFKCKEAECGSIAGTGLANGGNGSNNNGG